MPRIRKKTSNRGTTKDRRSIQNKVRETRKKRAKTAKKNTQWKSKHKKDPGIPNNFPYKDEILAEVAEQRRLKAEEKEQRKAEKKGKKSSKSNDDEVVEGDGEEGRPDVGKAADSDDETGVASLHARRLLKAKATSKPAMPIPELEEEEEEAPALVNRDLPNLAAVIDSADVVIQVLDARDPLSYRSSHIEDLARARDARETLFVLNKIDASSQEAVSSWLRHLRTEGTSFLFRSATRFLPEQTVTVQGKGKAKAREPTNDALGAEAVLEHLGKLGQAKGGDSPLIVAVVGFANVGKSAFINSLTQKASLPVYSLISASRGPTTTSLPQEVEVEVSGKRVKFLDTPGILWVKEEESETATSSRARDILLRNKGRIDRLKDPALPIEYLVNRANNEDLMLLYNLPAFSKGDCDSFLAGVSRSQQLVRKAGQLDIPGACRLVLRDWNTGKLRWCSTAPSTSLLKSSAGVSVNPREQAILDVLPSRKDLRRNGGLVRLTPGLIDPRKVAVEDLYEVNDSSSTHGDGGEGSDEEDSGASEEDIASEGDDDEDYDDDEAEDHLGESDVAEDSSSKGKRKRSPQAPMQPRKKVAFEKTRKTPAVPKPMLKKKPPVPAKVANQPKASKANATDADGDGYDFGQYF